MRISLSPSLKITSSQASVLARLVSAGCILHDEYVDVPEKEHALIEILPQEVVTNFVGKENIPQKIDIQIHISKYDIQKMLQLKQRIQRIKELVTRYSTLSIDRAACAQSTIQQQSYTINLICLFTTDKTGRQLQRPASVTPLEKMYISLYQVLDVLCGWRSQMMMTTLIDNWQPITVSFNFVTSKKPVMV